jgi:hypothetical protein
MTRYLFPWRATAAGDEDFALLDGAIRGVVRHNAASGTNRQYAALIEPGFLLGEFATSGDARRDSSRRHQALAHAGQLT